MIKSIKETSTYAGLKLSKNKYHAYLFYSADTELNNNIALCFANSLVCENNVGFDNCFACSQFINNSHPDVFIINQPSIKVEDANNIIDKLSTKPLSSEYKVFVVLNAENMNETAQNKLLKSLEEPNPSNIFIMTCSKTDKLLPTIMSRLNKIYVPKLSKSDKRIIASEFLTQNIDILKYEDTDLSLTEIINFENNSAYSQTISTIKTLFSTLKTSGDIPTVASSLNIPDKALFFPLLQDVFLSALNKTNKFDNELTTLINLNFTNKALIKCIPLIEDAYKKQMSNVNFNYILDNLLFNILKEKFLCR